MAVNKNAAEIVDKMIASIKFPSAKEIIDYMHSPESRDDHRKEFNDIEWDNQQPLGDPNYKIGDVVEFHVGGFGVISKVNVGDGGWANKYATDKVEGFDPPPYHAWHLEGDFKELTAKSPLHYLEGKEL